MTMHNEQYQNPSIPGQQSHFDEDGDTPRRIPVPPGQNRHSLSSQQNGNGRTPSSHSTTHAEKQRQPLPLPTQQWQPQTWTTLPTSPRSMPAQPMAPTPPLTPTRGVTTLYGPPASPHIMPAQRYQYQPSPVQTQQAARPWDAINRVTATAGLVPTPPPPDIPAYMRRPKRRRLTIRIAVILVLLTILIALGSFFEQYLLAGTANGSGSTLTPQTTLHTGPFVKLPLNAAQLNSLRHLVSYMQYKQLASMYVSRMSLDVELGQLIMVEYDTQTYAPDLDTMLNQLHAGGVIMYEFQMNTFNQTRNDI